jgi:hypothetical protein
MVVMEELLENKQAPFQKNSVKLASFYLNDDDG